MMGRVGRVCRVGKRIVFFSTWGGDPGCREAAARNLEPKGGRDGALQA